MTKARDDVLLSIVVINYRTPTLLIDCLKSLLPEIEHIDARIVVVDNFSNDDSPLYIKKWLTENDKELRVMFIQSNTNAGFSAGNNIGITALDAKFYLLLNSDTLIRPGAISALLKTVKEQVDFGLITPRLEWPDATPQESCFNFISPISEFISSTQTGFITKILSKYNVPLPVIGERSTTDWSSFACVLIRKEVFDDIGFMDDGYFMYFEDNEFCYRAQKADWKVLNEPDARVIHLRGGSSPVKENTKLRKRLPRYYYESRARYFYQVYGWSGLTLANLFWTAGRMISLTRQLLGRKDKAISEKQWLDIWTNWLSPLKNYTHPSSTKSK